MEVTTIKNSKPLESRNYQGCVYKITNTIDGKCYIGQTTQKLNRRLAHHFTPIKKIAYFGSIVDKYGKENFKTEVLECVKSKSKDALRLLLNKKERFYISLYKSNNLEYGYNLTPGACGKLSEETKQRMSISRIGNKNPMSGMSGSKSPVAKPVCQFSKDGVFIAEYETATQAAMLNNISQKNISCCCTGRLKSAGGYIWKHKSRKNGN
jgi:hypothetical protein